MTGFGVWVNSAATAHAGGSSDVVTLNAFVSDAAPNGPYINEPHAVYDPATDRTYLAYLGLERDLYVTYWDHQTGEVATPVEIATYPLPDDDNHGAPSICVDLDGYIHITWGGHGSVGELRHSRSDDPRDISAWTTQLLPKGTYSIIVCDPATGHLYVLYRASHPTTDHASTYPAHEFCGMQKSTDNGVNWSSPVGIIDSTGTPEASSDVYLNGATFGPDGLLYILWVLARGTSHGASTRQGVYVATLNPTDDTLAALDGTDLGTAITWAEHADCEVTAGTAELATFVVDAGRVLASWGSPNGATHQDCHVGVWDGNSWTVADTGIDQTPSVAFQALWLVDGAVRLASATLNGSMADLVVYGSTDGLTDWQEITTLAEGTTGEGYCRVAGVSAGPIVALAQQEPTGFAPTSATLSDLLPLYAVFDPARPHYSATAHDHDYAAPDHTHAVDDVADVRDAGRWEAVVSGTPATVVTTEDETDWLYAWTTE